MSEKKEEKREQDESIENLNEAIDEESELDKVLLEKDREIEEGINSLIRLQADFNNYKKRNEKEKSKLISFGIEKIACDLFPILDNFVRALESNENKSDSFYQGIEMIYNQLSNLLVENEIKEINPLYEKFDPNLHEAIHIKKDENYQGGTIIQVYKKGYILKDKVLKYAEVIVAE